MNKFLTKGALALVLGGCLASCHDDIATGSVIEGKLKAYEQVFREEFPNIDANHDWGFGTTTRSNITRADVPNANEWAAYYLVPDPLTEGQKLRAYRYFQTHKDLNYVDPHLTNFFVQQVYKGGDDPITANSLEKYTSAANNTFVGSERMDHLTAGSDRQHIYNFNNGTCSLNSDVMNNDTQINEAKHHTDQIQLMLGAKTDCFGYWNSEGSVGHELPYCALVSAADIDAWAESQNPVIGEKCDDKWHRSFVGFDFEQIKGENLYAKDWQEPYSIIYYREDLYGKTYPYLNSDQNQYVGDFFEFTDDSQATDEAKKQKLDQGYLPVSGGADKKWVKLSKCADGYFTDWIVTLTDAKPVGTEIVTPDSQTLPIDPTTTTTTTIQVETITETWEQLQLIEQGRVFCEDLGRVTRADIDFNDVVFDAYIYRKTPVTRTIIKKDGVEFSRESVSGTPTYYAEIILLAAGGTIPLSVAGTEVHGAFGAPSTTTIVNTIPTEDESYGNNFINTNAAVNLGTFDGISSISQIQIVVKLNEEVYELGSNYGDAPHKICVKKIGTPWTKERQKFWDAYTEFGNYVADHNVKFWEGSRNNELIYQCSWDNYTDRSTEIVETQKGSNSAWSTEQGPTTTTGGYQGGEVLSRKK